MKTTVISAVIFVCALTASISSRADVQVCFTGFSQISDSAKPMSLNFAGGEARLYEVSDISCQDLRKVEVGLETTAVTLSIGAAISTATGVGTPVAVGLEISAAGFDYINFLVSGIDCQIDKAKFQAQVKEAICGALNDGTSIHCDPKSLLITDENPADLVCRQPGQQI